MSGKKLILHALGTSGGPVDTKTQGFLFQFDNNFFMIDGGTGLSAIAELFKKQSLKESKIDNISYLYSDFSGNNEEIIDVKSSISKFTSENLSIFELNESNFSSNFKGKNVIEKSMDLYSKIQKNFVTHPHFDHISELIINLPVLYGTGYANLKKTIYGSSICNKYIQEHVLNDKTWPNLVNETASSMYSPEIKFGEIHTNQQLKVIPGIDIIRMNLNHGECQIENKTCIVQSSCYILLDRRNKHLHLIFGDCEWDEVNFPLLIGKTHDLIKNSKYKLKTVLIECSSINDEKVTELYGHMNPNMLCKTLGEFAYILDKEEKVNLCISHIKQTITLEDPRQVILHQMKDTMKKKNLNVYFELSVLINGLSYQL